MLLSLTDTENLLIDEGGQPLTSSTCNTLNIEVTEVRKQGDMLARGLHSEAEEGQLLDAVVMVKLRFLCDDKPVKLRTDRIMLLRVPVNTATLDDDYQTYFSSTASDSAFTRWAFPGTPAYFAEWPVGQNLQKGYELVVDRLGWIACARPVFNSTASTFCVQLDAPYNVQNTRAYIVFEGVNAVAALRAAPGSTAFCYPQAPVGYPVQVISTTKLDSGYELGNFNTEIGTLSNAAAITISLDLPFAQKRWCGAEGVSNVTTGSDYKYHAAGESFGVQIKEWALLSRAVFVADKSGKITYVEYVTEVSAEPNYAAALEALKKASIA
jgi:hypothetical protein